MFILSVLPLALLASSKPKGFVMTEHRLFLENAKDDIFPDEQEWKEFKVKIPLGVNGLAYKNCFKKGAEFIGVEGKSGKWVHISWDKMGNLLVQNEKEKLVVNIKEIEFADKNLTFSFFHRGLLIDFSGVVLFNTGLSESWRYYWVGGVDLGVVKVDNLYRADLEDGFMRNKFAQNDRWQIVSGDWTLKQYGGGMPTTESEAKSASFRRAANAFTLVGKGGRVTYGRTDWLNLYLEARMFFGKPDSYAKRDTLVGTIKGGEPIYANKKAIYQSNQIQEYPETNFFVGQGGKGGLEVLWGWSSLEQAFVLQIRTPEMKEWQELKRWNFRPYFSNWVRIGLLVRNGCDIMPYLDGECLGTFKNDWVARGKIYLQAGKTGKAEVDDIVICSLPKISSYGTPLFEKSVNFFQKKLVARKDKQTGQWTRSEVSFKEQPGKIKGLRMRLMRCNFPIYGDFTYRGSPESANGKYCFAIVNRFGKVVFLDLFTKTDAGWLNSSGKYDFCLEIAMRKGCLFRKESNKLVRLRSNINDKVLTVIIGGEAEKNLNLDFHAIYSKCLEHEFFEDSPTEWAWREGNFRMDVRWQCQRGWNFMMAKSRDLAVMYSKNAYGGYMELEFYNALRFCTPPPYYVKRDLGVGICTNGVSLASGYVLIYGDKDNSCTTLLRNGIPVAKSNAKIKTVRGATLHNYWWHGIIRKHGNLITVEIDNEVIIRYQDPRPINSGHLAFWTFRNAFSLAKISINAEKRQNRANLFRKSSLPEIDSPWFSLNRDQVTLTKLKVNVWKATNNIGGGTFAVRWKQPMIKPISLVGKSLLRIPCKFARGVKVGLHLDISGHSYYCRCTSYNQGLRYLLTPSFEKMAADKLYRKTNFTIQEIRSHILPAKMVNNVLEIDLRGAIRNIPNPQLEGVTFGNSSNLNYLMLGAGGNFVNSSYLFGLPEIK